MGLKRQLLAVFIFLSCTGGLFFLTALRLGFFTINRMEITGTKRVSDKEVLKRAGIRLGESMIFFEDDVKREILKNPWITSADIEREFLLQKVKIHVAEAEPFCLALGEEGKIYYMSETGKKLGAANFREGLDFPVFIGDGIWDYGLLEEALDILDLSSESNALNWKEISEIKLDSIYGITIFTTDGRQIDFGVRNLREKWRRVEKIITHSRKINLTEKYININSETIGVVNFDLDIKRRGREVWERNPI